MRRRKGIAGIVIDGATRDADELAAMKLPASPPPSPRRTVESGPGTVGYAVSCGHVVCHPGDAIFGDSDGIVVVARHELESIAAATEAQDAKKTTSAQKSAGSSAGARSHGCGA